MVERLSALREYLLGTERPAGQEGETAGEHRHWDRAQRAWRDHQHGEAVEIDHRR